MIHRIKDYQDLRKIGSWAKRNQFISSIFIRGSIRLCGIPFLRGFFSKDRILEQILIRDICLIVVLIIFFSTFFYCCLFSSNCFITFQKEFSSRVF
jgi:NADH:ubiquinone oxidoreductase subunit 5 (subunit L)/multisubunit Na+/H+ antiporter MnhA subunit